jgi:hypothetical protein
MFIKFTQRRTFWSPSGAVSLPLLRAHATPKRSQKSFTKTRVISSLGQKGAAGEVQEIQEIRKEYKSFTKPLSSGSVNLERLSPGLLALRLSNKDTRNALSPVMMTELLACVEKIEDLCVLEKDSDESPYGLILTGSHGTFCSGFGG